MKKFTAKDIIQIKNEKGAGQLKLKCVEFAGFEAMPISTQRLILSLKLFDLVSIDISNFKVIGKDENKQSIVEVTFFSIDDLIHQLEKEEAHHQKFVGDAIEILNPISLEAIKLHAASGEDRFVVRVSPMFSTYTPDEKNNYLSFLLVDNHELAGVNYLIEEELVESPSKSHLYVRFRALGLLENIPLLEMKKNRLERILNEIQSDFPEHTMLETPYTNKAVADIKEGLEKIGEVVYLFKHFVEIHKYNLDTPANIPLSQVITEEVYSGSPMYSPTLTYEPIAVNPLTNGTIFKVEGSIYF